jgi:hypothetical protein
MTRLMGFVIVVFLISPTVFVEGSASPTTPRKFDEFGDINCEDEMARLDNFAIQVQNEPSATAVIIFYGGRFRGRLPKRGDAAARAARLKPYLVERRSIPADRIVVINGGYREEWTAELWINPAGMALPQPSPSMPIEKIKFRKGKASPRQFRCNI